ncbi:MAG: metal ABC transporter substrate-binding protein [Acidimicrobiales bacterium]|nr:metal ABC transporter substrate-binding protein [Acidimicrobiales bacterium]
MLPPPRASIRTLAAPLAALLALVPAACGDTDEGSGILAGTPLWAAVTSDLACGEAVDALIPPGADHHAYEPSLADRGRIDEARLVVVNGGGVEGTLEDTLKASPTAIHRIHRGDGDPHLWLDPLAVADALPALAEALVQVAGLDANEVEACRRDLDGELRSLHAELADMIGTIPAEHRVLVTDHEALGRYVERYDLTVLDTVVHSHSSMEEPSAHDLEHLVEEMLAEGVRLVAAEEDGHDDAARRLAEMTGATFVELPLRLGPAQSPTGTHAGMLRTLTDRLVDALGDHSGHDSDDHSDDHSGDHSGDHDGDHDGDHSDDHG